MKKSIKKLGSVVKNSGSKTLMEIAPPPSERRLLGLSHYHQRAGVHPSPRQIQSHTQCVELVTGGRGWVEVFGGKTQWVEVNPGDLIWHYPGEKTIGRSDFQNPYSCMAVSFYEKKTPARTFPRITRWDELDEVRHFTHEIVGLHADDAFDSGVLLRYILGRLEFQAQLHMHRQKHHDLPVELRHAMELLNRRYTGPLRLTELAAAAGWSVPHLHDRFKIHLGLSPHQALIRRRIQAARELLAGTNDPIKSVAVSCGFSTAAAFCAQFKKSTRLSPAEYRKRQMYETKGE